MFTSNANKKQAQKQPHLPSLPFLKSPLVELYKQQLDSVRELLTEQDTLFTGIADTHEQTAVYLAGLVAQVRTDPAKVESDLLKLAETLPISAEKIRTGRDMTRQVLTNLGGRTDGK